MAIRACSVCGNSKPKPATPAAYQEEKYGPGMRVHNPCKPLNAQNKAWHCTICGLRTETPK